MPKQFVVRLRRGSPTGSIVANSQVITINPLTGSTIFPSNFTDGRLQGKVTTNNRVANFLKTVMAVPPTSTTTSTTSTTTRPPGTTTTTTLPAGQTTSTTTKAITSSTTSTTTQAPGTTSTTTTQAPAGPPVITNWSPNPATNQINELTAREFTAQFTVNDTVARTVYWKVVGNAGVTLEDFDGPTYGNFVTGVGTVTRSVFVRAKSDAIMESSETFSIMFFVNQSDLYTDSNAFYVSPLVTIQDGTDTINESIRIADADIPPYYAGSSIAFILAGGVGGSIVDLYDGVTRYPAATLDADGSLLRTLGPFNDIRTWTMEATFRATGHVRTVNFNVSQRPATGGSGGSYGGGSGGACPDPATAIMISPEQTRLAGSLQVGDLIYTVHEQSLEYGYFAITHAEIVEQPKLGIAFDNGTEIIVSLSHRFLVPGMQWVSARDLRPGHQVESVNGAVNIVSLTKHGVGPVVKLEVDQAHTYIAAGLISHNVKQLNLITEQVQLQ